MCSTSIAPSIAFLTLLSLELLSISTRSPGSPISSLPPSLLLLPQFPFSSTLLFGFDCVHLSPILRHADQISISKPISMPHLLRRRTSSSSCPPITSAQFHPLPQIDSDREFPPPLPHTSRVSFFPRSRTTSFAHRFPPSLFPAYFPAPPGCSPPSSSVSALDVRASCFWLADDISRPLLSLLFLSSIYYSFSLI